MIAHIPQPLARTLSATSTVLLTTLCAEVAGAQTYPGQYGPSTPYGTQPGYSSYTPLPGQRTDDGFLADRARSWGIVRVSNGAGINLARDGNARLSFDFDAVAGFRWALNRRLLLPVEAGYSLNTEPTLGGHFGTLGAGIELFGNRYMSVGYMPKLVIGAAWKDFAVGVRNTLSVPLLLHVFVIEAGHQWLHTSAGDQHEVRVQLGVDLAAATYALAYLAVSSVP